MERIVAESGLEPPPPDSAVQRLFNQVNANVMCQVPKTNRVEEHYVPNPIDLAPRNTIESEGMDGQVMKWIKKLDLEKCKWFYMSLSYNEISLINKFNIDMFISRARFRKGFQPHAFKKTITKSARKRIIASSLIMKDRPIKLRELIEADESIFGLCDFMDCMNYIQMILDYPIPNRQCSDDFHLQEGIVYIMNKYMGMLETKLYMVRMIKLNSDIGQAISKFLECTELIIHNPMFTAELVEEMTQYAKKLIDRIKPMSRDFLFE